MGVRRVGSRVVGSCLAMLVVHCTAVASAGADERIAFSSTAADEQSADIYVIAPDGSGRTRLTSDPGADVDPRWSPDGTRLVFTRIALAPGQVGPASIWTMGADGSGQKQLTAGIAGSDIKASWSPSGLAIAFTRTSAISRNTDVWTMDVDGGTRRRLTRSAGYDAFPDWSPDGDRIVFTSDREGDGELYVMDAGGTAKRRLTHGEGSDVHAAWSPDGKHIAFISDRDGSPQLYVVPAAGGEPRRVTSGVEGMDSPAGGYAPAWSPDGTRLAYTADREGDLEIVIISSAGGPVTPVTIDPGADFAPDWRPRPVAPPALR